MIDFDSHQSRLEACTAIGMSCENCVEHTARRMAKICDSLRDNGVSQMFFRIYTDSDCHQMRSFFEQSYLEAVVVAPALRKLPGVEVPLRAAFAAA